MKKKNYLIHNKNNEPVGVISIYRKIKVHRLKKFEIIVPSPIIAMIKKEQFDNLDNLIKDTMEHLNNLISFSNNNMEKIKLENKYKGLQDLARKINAAKNEYLNNPTNNLSYNKLINLYNSSKNFL